MKYRKKPVVIHALRYHGSNLQEILDFCNAERRPGEFPLWAQYNIPHKTLSIKTLEGWLDASEGDWIIRGVKGEFYPCKPDIFEMTYETVP